MNIEWLLYLVDVINHLGFLFSMGMVGAIVAAIGFFIETTNDSAYWSGDRKRDYWVAFWRRIKICSLVFFASCFINIFIPSEKTMYAIAFTKYAKRSDILEKALKAIEVKLYEVIKGAE